MDKAVLSKQDIADYLLILSRTPFFLGVGTAFVNLIIAIKFEYRLADLVSRFIFSGFLLLVFLVMITIANYLQKSVRKRKNQKTVAY